MSKKNLDLPRVLLDIAGTVYGISSEYVLSLHPIDKITPLPNAPMGSRGVISFRGNMIELVNIQKILGVQSLEEKVTTFVDVMDQRKEDHINWVETLKKCTQNKTEFTLTTDPHQCAFGKWYDAYDLSKTNITFHSAFAKFDKPHKAIHQVGVKADELIKRGKHDEALELIEKTKDTELAQMMGIFDEIKQAYKESNREIVVVIGNEKNTISIAVDNILAIEHLNETDEELINESMTDTKCINGLAKRKDGSLVILVDAEHILQNYGANTVVR